MQIKQEGVSLIELLITLTLGSFLLIGVLDIYLSNKKTYQYTQNLSRIQENARMATAWLSRDIRMAGFIGCGRLIDMPKLNILKTEGYGLISWNPEKIPPLNSFQYLSKKLVKNSDVLLIQFASTQGKKILSDANSKIETYQDVKNTRQILSDCENAEWIHPGSRILKNSYQSNAEIRDWHKIVYYIAETQRKNSKGYFIRALYRRDLNASATKASELIDGIDQITIRYGIKTRNQTINYSKADAVTDWSKVKNVQVNLLLTSLEEVSDQAIPYTFEEKIYSAIDRRLKKPWEIIISLREREEWQ